MTGNLKKSLRLFLLFLPCIVVLIPCWVMAANVNITAISVSDSNPQVGEVVGVTITYCDTANQTPFWLVALNPNSTTLQSCPAPNQIFMVDIGTTPTGINQVNGTQSDTSPSGNGWAGVGVPNSPPPCPYTQVFNVTIPANATYGPSNLIVAAGDYWVQCSNNIGSTTSIPVNIQLPSPTCAPLTVRTEGVTAAPDGLYLFDVNYSFINSGATSIVYNLPANTTLQSAGPNATTAAGSVTWNFGNVTLPEAGVAWALVSVNTGTLNGSIIPNSATLYSAGCGSSSSPTTNVTVQTPQISPLKSESASSLSDGSTVTYTLDWNATGQNLQIYDSYDNITAGNNTTGSAVPWGFDGTNYTVVPAGSPAANGTWTVGTDGQGNNFIVGSVTPQSGGGAPDQFPELIRNIPGYDICNDITVEGDLEIPASITVNCGGCAAGADAHMIIACNPTQGITIKAGMSIDSLPGNLFVQFNNDYGSVNWNSLGYDYSNGNPITINRGIWYTIKSQILFASGGSGITVVSDIWQTSNPGVQGSVTFVINSADDSLFTAPSCSGGWRAGWQADETTGTNWYSNLKIFGPGPIVNAVVWDNIPTGDTYVPGSASSGGIYNAATSVITWNAPGSFPTTMYSFDTPLNWAAVASCPGPIVNQFSMNSPSIPTTLSNSVTLSLTGCSPSPTPTVTLSPTFTDTPLPGNTNTFTPSPSPSFTPTPTSTLSPTSTLTPSFTPTVTNTPTITFTPTITLTPTNTPVGLHLWPNPYNPKYAVNSSLKVYQAPPGAVLSIYTVSGELVASATADQNGWILWYCRNKYGVQVSGGIYYYVVKTGDSTLLNGTLLIVRN